MTLSFLSSASTGQNAFFLQLNSFFGFRALCFKSVISLVIAVKPGFSIAPVNLLKLTIYKSNLSIKIYETSNQDTNHLA